MAEVRENLKTYFHENCFFGIVVLPYSELKNLGVATEISKPPHCPPKAACKNKNTFDLWYNFKTDN